MNTPTSTASGSPLSSSLDSNLVHVCRGSPPPFLEWDDSVHSPLGSLPGTSQDLEVEQHFCGRRDAPFFPLFVRQLSRGVSAHDLLAAQPLRYDD